MRPRRKEKSNVGKVVYRVLVTGLLAGFFTGTVHLFVINYLKKKASK